MREGHRASQRTALAAAGFGSRFDQVRRPERLSATRPKGGRCACGCARGRAGPGCRWKGYGREGGTIKGAPSTKHGHEGLPNVGGDRARGLPSHTKMGTVCVRSDSPITVPARPQACCRTSHSARAHSGNQARLDRESIHPFWSCHLAGVSQ